MDIFVRTLFNRVKWWFVMGWVKGDQSRQQVSQSLGAELHGKEQQELHFCLQCLHRIINRRFSKCRYK